MEERREREGVDKGRRKKGKREIKEREREDGEEENDTRRERVGRKWIERRERRKKRVEERNQLWIDILDMHRNFPDKLLQALSPLQR